MRAPVRLSLAPEQPLVVVADRLDATDRGRAAFALLHWACGVAADRSLGPVTAILWDCRPADWDLPDGLWVRHVEDINSWSVPWALMRHDATRPAGRKLREARVRAWWGLAGSEPAVVVLDDGRPELAHYVPPGASGVVGPGLDSPPLTAALWRRALRNRFRVPGGSRLVAGFGSPTWRSGIDQFLAAAALGPTGDHYVWFLPRSTEMPDRVRHDAGALGVAERFHWMGLRGTPPYALAGCDALIDAARGSRAEGADEVPVVRYGTAEAPAVGARPEQLADAIGHVELTPPELEDDAALAEVVGWPVP